MRNIGLVSAAVIAMAMAAMAGTVAASAPPVMQEPGETERVHRNSIRHLPFEQRMRLFGREVEGLIFEAVALTEREGLSGEAAQQRIRDYLHDQLRNGSRSEISPAFAGPDSLEPSVREMYMALAGVRRSLINSNRLGRGSDGDLGVSAALARRAESVAESERPLSAGLARVAESPAERNMEGRNVPGNAAAGQPATDAATTEVQQSQTTDDSDLDDEAGEPD